MSVRPARDVQRRFLFVFLDGVGLAPPGAENPLSWAPMPHLHAMLGGPLILGAGAGLEVPLGRNGVLLRELDACLGVPGLPQSATGQTALFTGVNAPRLIGEHIAAYPTVRLQEVIAHCSILMRAAQAGRRVFFANAHSERFWKMIEESRRRLGASTLTALAADAPIPSLDELRAGRAVLWDITHEVASRYLDYDLPLVPAEEAGLRLARLAASYDLVLFETFLTDLAGHRRLEAAWVLERLDAFLGALATSLPDDVTLVVSSDHGNLEDATTKAHSRNPVPLLVYGPAASRFVLAEAITDVAPIILTELGAAPCDAARNGGHQRGTGAAE